jgi:hypothetical protein
MPSEAKQLARKVIEMLTAQRVYFRRKQKADLIRAKVLEREVEELCRRTIAKKEQGILWDQQ